MKDLCEICCTNPCTYDMFICEECLEHMLLEMDDEDNLRKDAELIGKGDSTLVEKEG